MPGQTTELMAWEKEYLSESIWDRQVPLPPSLPDDETFLRICLSRVSQSPKFSPLPTHQRPRKQGETTLTAHWPRASLHVSVLLLPLQPSFTSCGREKLPFFF